MSNPTDNTGAAASATYRALVHSQAELIDANNTLNGLLEAYRSSSVRLPPLDPAVRRSAQVTTGHNRYGRFVRASVEVHSASAVNVLIETDDVGPTALTAAPPSVDDALEDLEGRLLAALADVRALRAEIAP